MNETATAPVATAAAPAAALRPSTRRYAGYALDLDGTVYLDDHLLPGADEAIARLRAEGARVVFVTNKPLDLAHGYADKLTRLGIPTSAEDVVTALDALVLYLRERHPQARVLTVAEPLVDSLLVDAGFTLGCEPEDVDIVVVSFDRTFDYAKLHAAYRAVRAGAAIVATNPDPYCPTADGGLPDCAAMLAAIEACTGARAEAIVGKPSSHMARAFLDRLGVPASETAMVGDRLATDVAMGNTAGMAGILVLSGATTPSDLARSDVRPHAVVSSLRDLL
ncbi:HAD-IIA family hydrolase [Streptomyces sp. NPDC014864]|uniref:HAD-IIA family hydrolase n=1 Tax=Streptomyces sp. NPDC014864 TaxID=3364924 RepID=UPI0036F57CFA